MYERLEHALRRLVHTEAPLKATLGYTIDGTYTVSVPANSAKYYARFADGSFAEVFHRGRASPTPDLPVEVGFDSAGNMVILGRDPERASLFADDDEVGPHSHARGSGMEFPLDPRLLTPLKAAPLAGMSVGAAQGAYWHGGALRWYGGGAVTVAAPGGANTWRWTVIALEPETRTLLALNGAAVVVSAPLDVATIPAIALGGAIPLAAMRVRNGQTALDEADFEDLRFGVGGRGTSHILLQEAQPQNTHAGTFTSGAWQKRVLNTEAADSANDASLSSGQVTLAAGTYRLRGSAPAFSVGAHQTRWQNLTDGFTVLIGTVEFADTVQTRSSIAGRFTLTAPATFELQHRCDLTRSSDGMGAAGNFETEVYAEVELWRE